MSERNNVAKADKPVPKIPQAPKPPARPPVGKVLTAAERNRPGKTTIRGAKKK
jgi:hypothetical protein